MKKTVMISIILCTMQLFCAVLVFGQNGVIKELTGTVELKRAGQATFVPAKAGDTVARDTVVSTGLKSTAIIAIGSTVITVRPLTRLTLAEISSSAGTETVNVSLQTGRVRVDVDPPAGTRTNASVQGPSATASVRGTSFEFDTREVKVEKGTVAFKGNKGGTMLVSAGSSSVITESNRVSDPVVTSAAELLPPSPVGSGDSGSTSIQEAPPPVVTADFTVTLIYE
ncbi:MAG: FecR family protein [Treponema sp.]|nr:FecR family protein [Treponema sp.]